MPHGNSRDCPGHAAMLDVQVTGTNAGKGHLDNGIPGVHQHRLGLFHQLKIPLRNIGIGLHGLSGHGKRLLL